MMSTLFNRPCSVHCTATPVRDFQRMPDAIQQMSCYTTCEATGDSGSCGEDGEGGDSGMRGDRGP